MTSNEVTLPNSSKKTELKVKAATWAAFLTSLAGLTLLGTTATDFIDALPDWAEVAVYSLLSPVVTWLAGYNARNRPEQLSDSTISAIEGWMRRHAPRYPRA